METRRDESKRRAITQAFVNRFTLGFREVKRMIIQDFVCITVTVKYCFCTKQTISLTVIMKDTIYLISGSGVGHKQTRQLSEAYMSTSLLSHAEPQHE